MEKIFIKNENYAPNYYFNEYSITYILYNFKSGLFEKIFEKKWGGGIFGFFFKFDLFNFFKSGVFDLFFQFYY